MKIAVLGWGSLKWDPRNIQIRGEWDEDGPFLPVEFARISRKERLTLVLYPDAKDVRTLWAYSTFENLHQAKENLREREGTVIEKIGYVSISDNKRNCQVIPDALDSIRRWAEEKELDAVIWTDLSSNFKERTGMDFNEDNIIKYLKNLTGKELEEAEKYVRRAPKQVKTRIRRRIEKELGWTYEQH